MENMAIPEWITKLPWDKIEASCKEYNIPKYLVGAIVQAESGGQPFKCRMEPQYAYISRVQQMAHELGITPMTEEIHQKMSWGLCQVMGGTARDLGFSDDIPQLVIPEVNLRYACLLLKRIMQKYGVMTDVIAAYNAGSVIKDKSGNYQNHVYVSKVSNLLRDLEHFLP